MPSLPDTPDVIDHPIHYQTDSGIEAIQVIEAFGTDYNHCAALKYLLRAGKKQAGSFVQDMMKARWHLDRCIAKGITDGR